MDTKSRESIYGSSVRHSAERGPDARKEADRLARVAWNHRMLGLRGPARCTRRPERRISLILRSAASAVPPARRLRRTSCAGRRRRQSTNWSATCDQIVAHIDRLNEMARCLSGERVSRRRGWARASRCNSSGDRTRWRPEAGATSKTQAHASREGCCVRIEDENGRPRHCSASESAQCAINQIRNEFFCWAERPCATGGDGLRRNPHCHGHAKRHGPR